MTMLSFRVQRADALEAQEWANRLGLDRSELLREALHQYLVKLKSEQEAEAWDHISAGDLEQSLAKIADWGPAEDWSDWADAAG
jgi:Ribbon-helix-helix protein, copG family